MSLYVSIDRIVVEGVSLSPDQGPALRRSLEADLGRLLVGSGPGSLSKVGIVPVLHATMQAATPYDTSAWAAAIAQATHGVLLP